jgi:hypothetical protein
VEFNAKSRPVPEKSRSSGRKPVQCSKSPPVPEIGFGTRALDQVIAAGPTGLRRAQRTALRHAKRHLEEAADSWKLETEWLKSFDAIHSARARYALVWRPRFLAALSMCHSPELAARHTRISCQMAYYHRKHDPEFAKQWDEAREYGIEMLHARAFQRSVEGDLEPIVYMGVVVGYVRRFDSRLQIEMLRAHRPDKFKTAGVAVNIGTRGDVFVLSEEQRHELQRINREYLLTAPVPTRANGGEESAPALPSRDVEERQP